MKIKNFTAFIGIFFLVLLSCCANAFSPVSDPNDLSSYSKSSFSHSSLLNSKLNTFSYSRDAHQLGGDEPIWVNMKSGMVLPKGAVIAGGEPKNLYILCRAQFKNGIYPGRLTESGCSISWGGLEVILNSFQILVCRSTLAWISVSHGSIPAYAIQGGMEDGHPIYVCQAQYSNGVYPGKVIGEVCTISWQGKEVAIKDYKVLTRV